jgi:hypothetical protein
MCDDFRNWLLPISAAWLSTARNATPRSGWEDVIDETALGGVLAEIQRDPARPSP